MSKAKIAWTCSTSFYHEIGECSVLLQPNKKMIDCGDPKLGKESCRPVKVKVTLAKLTKRKAKPKLKK